MLKNIFATILVILLISPWALTLSPSPISSDIQLQNYSDFDRLIDDIKLFFSSGDDKVRLALEIRGKEVDSALKNVEEKEFEKVAVHLSNAQDKLKIVQEEASLKTYEQISYSKNIINEKLDKNNLPVEFKEYAMEEEKTRLVAELTLKTFEYCKSLAQENYSLMLKQEKCNPENAPKGLEKEFEQLKQLQKESFNELMLDIRSCIDDPGTCNCEDNVNITQRAKCEKMVALAIKCEYKDDTIACDELISMKPVEEDGFAESFVPSFLMDLFKEKQYMVDYHIPKSDGVPPECYNENESVKTECAQYRYKKEIHSKCFDGDGKFLVEVCGGPDEKTPTMQDSIPQCFDEANQFLTEKCGKVTIVWNEQGLINYLFEGDLNKLIDNFEEASEQHQIDVNGMDGQNSINKMKEEIDGLEVEIGQRTFAPGTVKGIDYGNDGNNNVIDEGTNDIGDGGLVPEVKTDVGGNDGDDGLVPEVKTDTSGNGTDAS